jgi:hypothetical protein
MHAALKTQAERDLEQAERDVEEASRALADAEQEVLRYANAFQAAERRLMDAQFRVRAEQA